MRWMTALTWIVAVCLITGCVGLERSGDGEAQPTRPLQVDIVDNPDGSQTFVFRAEGLPPETKTAWKSAGRFGGGILTGNVPEILAGAGGLLGVLGTWIARKKSKAHAQERRKISAVVHGVETGTAKLRTELDAMLPEKFDDRDRVLDETAAMVKRMIARSASASGVGPDLAADVGRLTQPSP